MGQAPKSLPLNEEHSEEQPSSEVDKLPNDTDSSDAEDENLLKSENTNASEDNQSTDDE